MRVLVRRLLIVIAATAVVVGGTLWWRGTTSGPSPGSAAARPNVVLLTLDTTRADRLGSYGYAAASTPHLDRLAAGGVRFDQALSPAPLTLPAHATLMTGRQPYTHGVRNNGYFVLPPEQTTLAETFAAAGYDTAAFVSAFVLDRQMGLAQGFAHYDDRLDRGAAAGPALDLERRGDRTVQAAEAWLAARRADRPYFLWVHLFDPHEPYAAPKPFRERFAAAPYDGEIAFTDTLVGRLLAQTGAPGPDTLVVVAGDHGESLGAHGESTHGLFVYDAALRVPLIMAGAGVPGGTVVRAPVHLADVAPTILELAGSGLEKIDFSGDGQSVRGAMSGEADLEEERPLYAETYFPQFFMGWSPLHALRVGRWKYIDAPEPELYDVTADPGELANLIAREPARAEALARALASTLAAHTDTLAPEPISEDARRRLASLGYVSTAAPRSATTATRAPDPKRMVGVFEQLRAGNRALDAGDAAAAAQVARAVARQDPRNAFARLLQGRAALALGQHHEALEAFAAYLAEVPQSADGHHFMALAALRLGDRSRALAEEEAAIALDPRHTAALALRAGLLVSDGRADEGLASLREALARDPGNTSLLLELADLLADTGRFADAEQEYARVLAHDAAHGRALTGLGLVLAATARPAAALEPLTRAVEADPGDDEARFARAEVLATLGREAEARTEFERLARSAGRPDLRDAAARALKR